MSNSDKFVESRVLSTLDKKYGIFIGKESKEIKVLVERAELGLKTKAKIDFLINYCGYKRTYVTKM